MFVYSVKMDKAAEKLSAGKKSLIQGQPQQAVDHLAVSSDNCYYI